MLRRLAWVLVLLVALPLRAQDAPLGYQTPPPELVALVDAAPPPSVTLSPNGRTLLMVERPALPGIVELAQPEIGLAGLRVNPATNGPSRAQTFSGLVLRGTGADDAERRVTGLPDDARLRNVAFSPDGARIAFTLDTDEAVELWVAEVGSASARRLTERALNDVAWGRPFEWTADGRLVVRAIPTDRGEAPTPPRAPSGPTIQESAGEAAPARTFQDLLTDAHSEALFEHYFDAEVLVLALDGTATDLGIRGLVLGFEPAPDGRHLHVATTHRPFSYLVPLNRFPQRHAIHDLADGRLVAVVAENPLAETVPTGFGSVPTGPRSLSWRADAPATLVWAEALDGGDIRARAEHRDRILALDAPFDGEPRELARTEMRYAGITWSEEGFALLDESLWQTRTRRTWMIRPDAPLNDAATEPRLVFDVSTEDRYNDPGRPMTTTNAAGATVLRTDGEAIYLTSVGASEEGNRPFLRRHDLASGETTELFRSASPHYEVPVTLLDDATLLTRREAPTEPPNFFARDLASGDATALTAFPHPYPELADVQREAITYQRADGVTLSAVLYLPPGYDAERDGPLPTLLWAYPREFRTADAAGQRADSPYQFMNVSYWGPVAFVTRGYAVLDNTAMPILGEGDDEPNDTFVEQLVASAEAAIAEGARRGVVDPSRVGIGGHSYGAFMTANLLAHSDLFRAGIARSGAFNRSLTPFGFQAEERTYWEAPEVYNAMSPFMHAHRINQPILLIHGAVDNNSGTFPMQSERLYSAINGLGGTARLVMLPHESHGYRARESVLHMLWEQDRWLERYVRQAEVTADAAGQPEATDG